MPVAGARLVSGDALDDEQSEAPVKNGSLYWPWPSQPKTATPSWWLAGS